MQSSKKHIKQPNPRLNANPFSVLLFLHMLPVFWRNFKYGLKEEDLFDVLESHKSSTVADRLELVFEEERKHRKKYALHVSMWKLWKWGIVATGIIQAAKDVFMVVCLPYAVGELVPYFGSKSKTVSDSSAYMFASVIIVNLVIDKVVSHAIYMWLKHISMKMRVACCSMVYRKALRLDLKTFNNQTHIGQIINLMSNDVSKFDIGLVSCHYVWTAPLQVSVATYMLYRIVGVSAFAGIGFILSFVPLQFFMGKKNSVIRLKTAIRTDERVRLMNEILSGIQIIKMYTWEKPFAKIISLARRAEMKWIRRHFYIESVIFSLEMFVTRTCLFLTILVFLSLGYNINGDIAYSITTIYNVIRTVVTIILSISIAYLGEIHIGITRLEEFLNLDEVQWVDPIDSKRVSNTNASVNSTNEINKNYFSDAAILFENASVKWSDDAPSSTLKNINLSIVHNQLVAVIGQVGSGKSTLLHTILRELPITSGNLEVRGKVSYAPQEAWLFLGTVRQNIIFDDPYDEVRYRRVVKVCALESDFKMLPSGDRTKVREKGKSLSGGQKARINLARCVYRHADIYLLDDPLSAVDTKVGRQLYDSCIKGFLKDKLCILVTHQLQYLENADKIIVLSDGMVAGTGTYNELRSGSSDFADLLKKADSEKQDEQQNVVATEGWRERASSKVSTQDLEEDDEEDDEETAGVGSLGLPIYRDYFRMGGNYFIMLGILFCFVIAHGAGSSGDLFVAEWINAEQIASEQPGYDSPLREKSFVVPIYTIITVGTIVLGLAHSALFFMFLVRASTNIHNIIFEKILYARMTFFNNNPTGRILNRFSKDLGIVDEYMPFVLIDIIDILFVVVATIFLSCKINPWFLLPWFALLILLYFVRIVYMETSRQVKRIEGITRSPIYNHAGASLSGLTTIRAFNAQETLIKEFDNVQDHHSSAWYLYISSSEAFGVWIDLTFIIFVAATLASFLISQEGYYEGDVGLIISLYIALASMLQWGIFQWSEMENNMTSIERVIEYSKQEMEPIRPPLSYLPHAWPEFGKVAFDNISMRYEPNGTPVLKNVSLVINSGEKVGVVGRTGAGKSSIIAALFQFYYLTGIIIIDGVNTSLVPLDVLRSKISIIPQECVLFSGTMRKNLDPFDEYSDDLLWSALEQVELKSVIEAAPGALSTFISESGSNFSIGQRQLICLARAILRNNTIIIMDEATANIDSHTDALIQKTIKTQFANCTILTVAHRLNTIIDYDKVLVMEKGEVAEYNSPYILLQNTRGIFHSMVQTTGGTTSRQLHAAAEEAYKMKAASVDKRASLESSIKTVSERSFPSLVQDDEDLVDEDQDITDLDLASRVSDEHPPS